MKTLENDKLPIMIMYDRTLLWILFSLLVIGFIMVTSASMPIAQLTKNDAFYFAKHDAFYILISFCISLFTLSKPMEFWYRYSNIMLIVSIIMLIIVLIFGHPVHGASRWLVLGPLRLQPAEITKLSSFCYLCSYLVRKLNEVRNNAWGFCKPISVMLILALLLLAQPDLGTVIILFITTLSMLFLAGARLYQILSFIFSGVSLLIFLVLVTPYRIHRIISFWHPWENLFGSGYQLTQSFMAFGRGEFWGEGLGNSIQKFEYLPEAYTDFIFSIIAEELGYIGVVLILLMLFFLPFRAMLIGKRALEIGQSFSGFLACAIGIWFALQEFINIGTTSGIIPTKGLTLPLISYGGSSLMVMSTAVMFLLRIDYETRLKKSHVFTRGS